MKKWLTILISSVIVIALVTGGILAVRHVYFDEDEEDIVRAEKGDNVEIHYIGRLSDSRLYDEERIFDTSYEDMTEEDPRFTLTYAERERGDPFEFTLGEGQVIEGWEENIKGMREGESKTFNVTPEKGYGQPDAGLIYNVEKTETIPMREKIHIENFRDLHGQPARNMVVEHEFWGWDMIVTQIGREEVKIRHDPDVGETHNTYAEENWESTVESIDSNANDGVGAIEVTHEIENGAMVETIHLSHHDDRFLGMDETGVAYEEDDQIILDFNDEVVGRTLNFEVELVNIEKG